MPDPKPKPPIDFDEVDAGFFPQDGNQGMPSSDLGMPSRFFSEGGDTFDPGILRPKRGRECLHVRDSQRRRSSMDFHIPTISVLVRFLLWFAIINCRILALVELHFCYFSCRVLVPGIQCIVH